MNLLEVSYPKHLVQTAKIKQLEVKGVTISDKNFVTKKGVFCHDRLVVGK